MARGKKSPTLKDAVAHKTKSGSLPDELIDAAKQQQKEMPDAAKQQNAAQAKRTPTLEEVVAKLKQHGIHFDN